MAWRKYLPMSLMAAGAFVLVVGVMGPPVRADKPGTLKISSNPACTGAGMANDPKPGEVFFVGGTNFDTARSIRVAITDGMTASSPIVFGPTALFKPAAPGGTFCVGPITLPAGHYKAYAGPSAPENHDKTKVFKVCGEPEVPVVTTAPPVVTTVPPVVTTVPPTSEVPVVTTVPPVVTTAPPVVTTVPPVVTTVPPVVSQAPPVVTAGSVATTAVAAQAGALPKTGTGTTMVALGVALVLTGGVLELVTRRRPSS